MPPRYVIPAPRARPVEGRCPDIPDLRARHWRGYGFPVPMADERTSELRLRAAVESAPSGLLMTDARGVIVLVNREVERLTGFAREELLGRQVDLLVPPRFREGHVGFRAGFMADPRVRVMGAGRDLFLLRKDGTEVPVEIGLTPVVTAEGVFVLSAIVDITSRKLAEREHRRLEEQLIQSQKIEAVGTLAGGIAHDFNNILASIIGYGELVRASLSSEKGAADLAQLLRAAERGKQLVERIMLFSRRQEQARRPLALGETIAEAANLLRATLPASVDIRVEIPPDLPRVSADAVSVQQIIMNLGTNAAHAMPDGGKFHVQVASFYARDSVARAHPGLREGHYVLVEARDTGTGMDRTTRERAFEPFFTTKPPGSGTGLGLSMVHTIMQGHEGLVEIESEPGRGTTIRCFFPALETDVEERLAAHTETPVGHGEGVLVVDDEPGLGRAVERLLQSLGYSVTLETDGIEALERFRADPDAFSVVLTDYLMPRLAGLDLAREVSRLRPGVAVVLQTGFIEDLPLETVAAAGVRRVLRKPATRHMLGEALHEALHPAPAS